MRRPDDQLVSVFPELGVREGVPLRGGGAVVVALHKHVGDVLAKVDLAVGCYALVLHQFQVLRG